MTISLLGTLITSKLDDMTNQENGTHNTQINSDIIRDPVKPTRAHPNNFGTSRCVRKRNGKRRGVTTISNTNNVVTNVEDVNADDRSGPILNVKDTTGGNPTTSTHEVPNVAAVRRCSLCKTPGHTKKNCLTKVIVTNEDENPNLASTQCFINGLNSTQVTHSCMYIFFLIDNKTIPYK